MGDHKARGYQQILPNSKCKNGSCSFFGSDDNGGYCSSCYKITSTVTLVKSNSIKQCRSTGCEYFGSADKDGFCSGCYTESSVPANGDATSPSSPVGNPPELKLNTPEVARKLAIAPSEASPQDKERTPQQAEEPDQKSTDASNKKTRDTLSLLAAAGMKDFSQEPTQSEISLAGTEKTAVLDDSAEQAKKRSELSLEGAVAEKKVGVSFNSPDALCTKCRRRVGLYGFNCKCGQMFCGKHHQPEDHNCSFDYKKAGREKIAKSNPLLKASKIDKI